MFLFQSVEDIKDYSYIMKDIFGNPENLEVGDSILPANEQWRRLFCFSWIYYLFLVIFKKPIELIYL